jgi:hypothetical protein
MTNISIHAPEQSSSFTTVITAILATTVTVIAGVLAFAPFFAPITG